MVFLLILLFFSPLVIIVPVFWNCVKFWECFFEWKSIGVFLVPLNVCESLDLSMRYTGEYRAQKLLLRKFNNCCVRNALFVCYSKNRNKNKACAFLIVGDVFCRLLHS